MDDVLVSIRCITYNHAPYIRQCLDGFVMQKTNFRFEAIVHDDASTDGTADIIREYAEKYPEIIKPILEIENQYSKHNGSIGQILDAAMSPTSKYVAMCEGDDYWIDPYKLQKQVDFLEGHPEYSMSHTSIRYYYEQEKKFYDSRDIEINNSIIRKELTREDVLSSYRIQTLTVVMRRDLYEKARESDSFLFKSGYLKMGDTQLWYTLFSYGKIHFLPEVTGVYRKNNGSVTRSWENGGIFRFSLSSYELRMYLCQRDHLRDDYRRQVEHAYNKALIIYKCFNPKFEPLYPLNHENVFWLLLLMRLRLLKFFLYGMMIARKSGGQLYHLIKKKL